MMTVYDRIFVRKIRTASAVKENTARKRKAPERVGENVKISLVLNSAAAVRIYTDSNKVMIDGKRVTAKTSKFGKYYELADIPAQNLFDSHILTIDGDDYVFSPMSYVYRTLNNPNTNEKLAIVAKTFYSYAYSAREYVE